MTHALNIVRSRLMWLWPLVKDPLALVPVLKAHGVTGIVPQESDNALVWCRQWASQVKAAGLDVVCGFGRIDAKHILDALDVPDVAGVMIDQEAWSSVADSDALVTEVLRHRGDAAARIVDCHYPCVVSTPDGHHTGHDKIAKAWGPLCGLRAPQCYNEVPLSPDGWVSKRIAWSRHPSQYPSIGSPADTVRASVQLYRRSVNDHVAVLLAEGETGSVWLWDWHEADAAAKVALRVVHELERRGHFGPDAVVAFQRSAGLTTDGLGPITCRELGVETPPLTIIHWHS